MASKPHPCARSTTKPLMPRPSIRLIESTCNRFPAAHAQRDNSGDRRSLFSAGAPAAGGRPSGPPPPPPPSRRPRQSAPARCRRPGRVQYGAAASGAAAAAGCAVGRRPGADRAVTTDRSAALASARRRSQRCERAREPARPAWERQ